MKQQSLIPSDCFRLALLAVLLLVPTHAWKPPQRHNVLAKFETRGGNQDTSDNEASSPKPNDDEAVVGLKSHRRSNAVGDPDDDGSDDEDDDDEDDLDDSDLDTDDFLEEDDFFLGEPKVEETDGPNEDDLENRSQPQQQQLEVEMEFVSGDEEEDDDDEEEEEKAAKIVKEIPARSRSGGGVGVVRPRFFGGGRRNNNHKKEQEQENAKQEQHEQHEGGGDQQEEEQKKAEQSALLLQETILEAWQPHIFWPNDLDHTYLVEHATQWDASSRARLDRRTLYAGLLLEWGSSLSPSSSDSNTAASTTSTRTFLNPDVSHALRSTLALATQPSWRRKLRVAQNSGIRLYTHAHEAATTSNNNNHPTPDLNGESNSNNPQTAAPRQPTLSMQETLCASLAHSLGAGMVVLDDATIAAVRAHVLQQHPSEGNAVKPARLLQRLLHHASCKASGASLATAMQRDMDALLDDPHDERAKKSWLEMVEWEEASRSRATTKDEEEEASETTEPETAVAPTAKRIPLVIFVRVDASPSLLKSKSAVEALLRECNGGANGDGRNLLVLGKGVDASHNKNTPPPAIGSNSNNNNMESSGDASSQFSAQQQQQQQQQHPWFGFSPNNQNASGQNDPPGSKRFNIFLARTVDSDGNPGILGAVAAPQAGNLFPQMMAMQARERLNQMNRPNDSANNNHDESNPAREALERWANMLHQQQQQGGNAPNMLQFFNASLAQPGGNTQQQQPPPPPPSVIQETLQRALTEMLSKLTEMSEEEGGDDNSTPELHRAFAQVLRNESLRRGIMENLSRAAPALSDPKCQGVMLSVYVPPDPQLGHQPSNNNNKSSGVQHPNPHQQANMNGWFQRILNNQNEEANAASSSSSSNNKKEDAEKSKQRRVRTMAAAAAVAAANSAEASRRSAKSNKDTTNNETKREGRAAKNLRKLEAACRPIAIPAPSDPVRARSWEAWMDRELGSALFRWNRKALNEQLEKRSLTLQTKVGGSSRIGSALRSMLSVRDISKEMEAVVQLAIEMEAELAQRRSLLTGTGKNESKLEADPSMDQLLLKTETTTSDDTSSMDADTKTTDDVSDVLWLHPTTLEGAISRVCRISPSPYGGQSGSNQAVVHRTKEETMALAQDKHEKALVSQVISPSEIGVTYDNIGGLKEVKELLRQSITYPLKFPHLYSEGIAREAVKGVLLFGPPGTGKTMLAKAVATEGGASFLSVDASSVENKWLGESEKNAKAVFTLARRLSPCVVFIDEVDSLLSSREGTSDDSAHGTLTSVKTTMMSEWDGLNSGTNGLGGKGDRVIVVGSTNRPFDLDEAVLRRFPRRLLVDLPDLETRKEILEVTLAENRLDPQVNLTRVAERLEGYTGSDIKEVCREAVVHISHEHAKQLDQGLHLSSDDEVSQELRPVNSQDFDRALSKLKRSVSETGRELARVWEWNDEYGEIKRKDSVSTPKMTSMYL